MASIDTQIPKCNRLMHRINRYTNTSNEISWRLMAVDLQKQQKNMFVIVGKFQNFYAADACTIRLDATRDKNLFYHHWASIACC
jgi:hypothetical protein